MRLHRKRTDRNFQTINPTGQWKEEKVLAVTNQDSPGLNPAFRRLDLPRVPPAGQNAHLCTAAVRSALSVCVGSTGNARRKSWTSAKAERYMAMPAINTGWPGGSQHLSPAVYFCHVNSRSAKFVGLKRQPINIYCRHATSYSGRRRRWTTASLRNGRMNSVQREITASCVSA